MIGASAALGGAAVWVLSRKGGTLAKLTSSRELRVISSVRVGPKGHLVLAGIGDRAILLGVTDQAVRRIAWMPAEQIVSSEPAVANVAAADVVNGANRGITSYDPPRRSDRASTAIVPASGRAVSESGLSPVFRAAASPAGKGGFADILRRIGGRNVDAPPAQAAEELSPAAALAALRQDSVQWSRGATNAAKSSPALVGDAPSPEADAASEGGHGSDLEQQAAGILKRRSRGKRA